MSEDIRVKIGQEIAELRQEHELTQQELADAVGITRVHLSRIESGKYSVGIDIIDRLASALGAHLEIKKGKR